MTDKMVFGQYYNVNSWLHRLDPRTKIISLFVLMIAVFFFQSLWGLLGMFAIVLILIISSKIPFLRFLQTLKMMAMLLIFTVVFQVFFAQYNTTARYTFNFTLGLWSLLIIVSVLILFFLSKKLIRKGRMFLFLVLAVLLMYLQTIMPENIVFFNYSLKVYNEGLMSAGAIMIRIINLISLSSLLTLTTKPTDLNNGLESVAKPLKYIKINVSIMAMMISIALRFIPTLINEAFRILKAQASRGVDFAEGKLKDKIVQIISLLIPMFVVAYKRAEDLANAMEARAYIPGAKRTNINLLAYKASDIITYIFSALIFATAIFLRVKYAL